MTGRENNYQKMAESARQLFLQKDSSRTAAFWELREDGQFIYPVFLGETYRLEKGSGYLTAMPTCEAQRAASVEETMTIYDLLFYALEKTGHRPAASGHMTTVGGLGGIIGSGHQQLLQNNAFAAHFAGKLPDWKHACEHVGGIPYGKSDAGYIFPVFRDLSVCVQFWDADEEFPANAEFLFDDNALSYLHYETLWYLMGCVKNRLLYYAGP